MAQEDDLLEEQEKQRQLALLSDTQGNDVGTVDSTPPSANPEPSGSGDALTDYLLKQQSASQSNQQKLADAESTANTNRLYARLGGAAAQASSGLSHANNFSDAPFDQLAKDAEAPVQAIKDQASLQNPQDKLLSNYLLSKGRLDVSKDRLGVQKDSQVERGRHNQETEGIGKKHNDIIGNYFGKKVDQAQQGIDLRTGNQAAAAAGKFQNDKVISTSNTQLAQIQKGLGRLDDVDAGKVPFSTTIKADIEKDLANVISGSNSSALGQLERVEFHPYVQKWQAMLDQIHGYQGDINAPAYRKQLRDQLNGLKADIAAIQGHRSAQLQKAYGTAYSGNKLATKVVNENAESLGAGGEKPPATATARAPQQSGKRGNVITPNGERRSLPLDQIDDYIKETPGAKRE